MNFCMKTGKKNRMYLNTIVIFEGSDHHLGNSSLNELFEPTLNALKYNNLIFCHNCVFK